MFKKSTLVSLLAIAVASPAIAAQLPSGPAANPDYRDDEIVVTASRSGDAIPTSLIGASITVLDARTLENRQTRVVSDILRDVPGVAVNRTGGVGVGGLTQVRIRGSEGNHVLVFVDGIKSSDVSQGEFEFGGLFADDAARIEVLRGQQSALYGSDAIGGVISYTTLTGREAPGFSARAEGGSMGTFTGTARAAGASEDFDYAISGTYFHTDGSPTARTGTRDLGANNRGVSAKANWTPSPEFKLTAVGRYNRTRADSNNQNIGPDSPIVRGYPVITVMDTPGSYSVSRSFSGLLRAELSLFDDAWTNALSAQIFDGKRDGYRATGRSSGAEGTRYRSSFVSTVRFGDERFQNRLTAAVDAEREDFRNTSPATSGAFAGKHRIETLGFVAQYDLTVDERLALSASARIDDSNRFDDITTHRVSASYLLPTGTRVHAAHGTGVKAPTGGELFGYSDGKYIGNPDLKPEKSRGWEAGVEQTLLDNRVKLGATYFRSRFFNQIDMRGAFIDGNYVSTTYNNDVVTRQKGIEVFGQTRFADWSADASYTWLKAPQTITALANPAPADGSYQAPVPVVTQAVRRPKNIASFNLTYAPQEMPFSATLTVRYNGKQRDYAFNPSYDRLLVDLKAYTLVNLAATFDVTDNVQLFGRVENLFDEDYEEVFTFATSGRAAYGGVRVRF